MRPPILRHCTRDLQAGRRDASATAARPPAASLARHGRARQAVIPRRPGPKVHRLPRRQATGSRCLLLGGASRDDPLPGSVASFTARVRWRLHQTSLGGYKRPPYGTLWKAPRTFAPSAAVAAGGLSAARPARRSRPGGRDGRPGAALGRTRPCADPAQPVFCKSHTCPVGTAGAEGPPVGGSNGPQGQDLTPGFPGPGISPPRSR